jgi:transcriptional regulator with GAF, ATPase, and Fis domain
MEAVASTHLEQWCRQMDQLVAELSSTLSDIESADLGGAIGSMLQRIALAVSVDRVVLVEYGSDGEPEHSYRWEDPSIDMEGDAADAAQASWLWDWLRPKRDALVLERIPADLPVQAVTPALVEHLRPLPLRSLLVMPSKIGGDLTCALSLEGLRDVHPWPPPLVDRLQVLTAIVAAALHRRRQDFALRQSQNDLARLTAQLEREREPFDHDGAAVPDFEDIIGKSPSLRAALVRVQEVAPTVSSVLLLGETGTGKELFARAIHARSPRRSNPLVIVNCAALPPTLIESELFGHARGAFTGAVATRQGRFELAHRGTLFLDEIGDLPLDLQTKLLRVLQEGSFERLGSSLTQKVDVRIIAATHRDLAKAVADGSFRDDLYYRLSVFPIQLPALRERREDILDLVWFIIHKRQRSMQRWIKRVPESVMEVLQRHNWPGNVRELENVIERALIHSTGDTLRLLDERLERPEAAVAPDDATLTTVERTHIEEVLRACRWRINGPGNAAERLGLHPNTLRFRMKKLGIVRDPSRAGVQIASA